MTPEQFSEMNARFDRLQILLHAQQRWMVLQFAKHQARLDTLVRRSNGRRKLIDERQRLKTSEEELTESLECSFQELRDLARDLLSEKPPIPESGGDHFPM